MSDFYQTIMGQKFFNGQLPELVRSINRLADAIEESNRLRQKEEKPGPEADLLIK